MRKLAFLLALLFALLFAACGNPEEELSATEAIPFFETYATTETTAAYTIVARENPIAIDLSDESHAVNSLRTLYFGNKELFNNIKDDLRGMRDFFYWRYRINSANSEVIDARVRNDNSNIDLHFSPEEISIFLLFKLRHYFALFESPKWYSVKLSHYWPNEDDDTVWNHFVAFEFGFLESQSNQYFGIYYDPVFTESAKRQYPLEDGWYIGTGYVVF